MSTSPGLFITGFPGFIGQQLVQRLHAEHPDATLYLLVEPRMVFEAERRCRRLERDEPGLAGRWRLVVGDLREHGLGIDEASLAQLRDHITHVWHLAALYDLAATQSAAYAVNVTGTRRLLDLCETLPGLQRLHYVSTCYVAGSRSGTIYEEDLDHGQEFKNHYESTKCWAEMEVQGRWGRLPTTIYRPAIVAGHSRTGVAAKADGPYYIVQLLLAMPRWLPMLHVGPSRATFNMVPVDFVVEAMVRLSRQEQTVGQVFHLADPNPCTARELMDLTLHTLGRPAAVGRVPLRLANAALGMGAVGRALGIPPQSLAYLDHPARFDVSNTAAALGDALLCPRLADYWPTLVAYARAHPELFRRAS
ncbi:MAG: SDR family oxidoreductase [Deltaproteobacteria bacterium]|nr:SDR family oxidoreductase [Deltaproteobacteria bacterium]